MHKHKQNSETFPSEICFSSPINYTPYRGSDLLACIVSRGGSRTAATSKVELFVTIVNDWKLLTIIIKSSTLGVAAVLNPPLVNIFSMRCLERFSKNWYCFQVAILSRKPYFDQLIRKSTLDCSMQAITFSLTFFGILEIRTHEKHKKRNLNY